MLGMRVERDRDERGRKKREDLAFRQPCETTKTIFKKCIDIVGKIHADGYIEAYSN